MTLEGFNMMMCDDLRLTWNYTGGILLDLGLYCDDLTLSVPAYYSLAPPGDHGRI